MALIQVVRSILIKRPLEEVYAFSTDHTQAHRWQDGLTLFEQITPGPVEAGTRFRQKYKEGYELEILITEAIENERFYSEVAHKWVDAVSKTDYKTHPQGTMLTTHFSMQLKITLLDMVSFMIEPTVKRKQAASLENLKKLMESKR